MAKKDIEIQGGLNLEFLLDNFDFEKSKNQIKQGFVLEGGSGCFSDSQLVETDKGLININEIKVGDFVKTLNPITKLQGFSPVTKTHEYKNTKPCVRVKLKSGKVIECTTDHKFYFEGGWHSIKNILSLWKKKYGNMEVYT